MERRALGRSGVSIPPVMIGGNVVGWTADRSGSFRVLDACLDAGLNAIDTADVCSAWAPEHQGGESETVIGDWRAERVLLRDRVVIATKVGMRMGSGEDGLSPGWIGRAVEASAPAAPHRRHRSLPGAPEDETTPLADTFGVFARLIERGKVRRSAHRTARHPGCGARSRRANGSACRATRPRGRTTTLRATRLRGGARRAPPRARNRRGPVSRAGGGLPHGQ